MTASPSANAPLTQSLSVVVPVYNSAATLPDLVTRLGALLPTMAQQYELILVNDGSRDQSWAGIAAQCAQHDWVTGLDLMRNYGQHNALLCGIRAARYELIVTVDDDLQHPPEEIPRLLAKLAEGYDVVYGTPQRETHGLFRDLSSVITKLALQTAMGPGVPARNVSAFRVFRTILREAFKQYSGPFVSVDVLLTWGTGRFGAVPVQHEARKVGASNYTFGKLVTHALNMLTGFSTVPLRLASLLGFGFTIFGFLVLLYVLGRYLIQGGGVPGFPFLASVIAIFSGVQLTALGIMGEYLARMYSRMMDRPTYAIRTTKSAGPEKE